MATYPSLERIDCPDGAVAAGTQLRQQVNVETPRGFRDVASTPMRTACPRTMPWPHRDAAMWYKQLFHGYMSAHTVHAVGKQGGNLTPLVAAEDAELRAYAMSPTATSGLDLSLKPRRIGVWVHVQEVAARGALGERILDALAHWNAAIGTLARATILAGSDADELLAMTKYQNGAMRRAACKEWTFRVSVRWWCPCTRTPRTETASFSHTPANTNAAVADIQQAMVRLVGTHDVSFPADIMKVVQRAVPLNCYMHSIHDAAVAFMAMCTGTPSVTLDPIVKTVAGGPLSNTGVVVRMCNKSLGKQGITHSSAFHGVLLAFDARTTDAVAFALEACESGEGYLRVPLGVQEESMGLHMCAVQAQKHPLGASISLFAATGVAGQPIHSPHSWVWIESAAVRPIEAALLHQFDARPCAKSSIVPHNQALTEAYKTHFRRASDLYLSLDSAHNDTMPRIASTTSTDFETVCDNPLVAIEQDDEVVTNERFLLAAMRCDLQSQRTTIGEAFAYLSEVGPPSSVTKMMLHAAGRLGVHASLNAMLELCVDAVQVHNTPLPCVEENERLKRLASVALAALAEDAPPPKRAALASVSSRDRIRRIITACDLDRGDSVTVAVGKTHSSKITLKVTKAVCSLLDTPDNNMPTYCDVVQGVISKALASNDDSTIQALIAKALHLQVVFTGMHSHSCAYFMVSCPCDEDGDSAVPVRLERIGLSTDPIEATVDDMISESDLRILIVERRKDNKYRITATTRRARST